MSRKVFPAAAYLAVLLTCAAIPAGASTIMRMTLSGIGSNISLNNFSFGVTGHYVHTGAGWHVEAPAASDFSINRTIDAFSPLIQQAVVLGTHISSGDIEFVWSTYSPTVPYLDYHFTDGLISGYQFNGGGGGLPEEKVTFTFEHLTVTYAGNLNNPWGAVLPFSSQVQEGPFALNFAYDVAFDAAQFGDSDILMDATIPGQYQPVPEPASILLLGSGLMGIVGAIRRKRAS